MVPSTLFDASLFDFIKAVPPGAAFFRAVAKQALEALGGDVGLAEADPVAVVPEHHI